MSGCKTVFQGGGVMWMADVERYDWAFLASTHGGSGLFRADIEFGEVLDRCRGRLVYLATPYSKLAVNLDGQFCPAQSDMAGIEAAKWLNHLGVNGVTAVSPIVQSVAMLSADPMRSLDPLDGKFWTAWRAPMMTGCGAVIVPQIDDWRQSLGVWREVCWALDVSKPVFVVRKGSEFGGWV